MSRRTKYGESIKIKILMIYWMLVAKENKCLYFKRRIKKKKKKISDIYDFYYLAFLTRVHSHMSFHVIPKLF